MPTKKSSGRKGKGRKGSGTGKPRTPQEDAAQNVQGGVLVTLVAGPNGGQGIDVKPVEGTAPREIPTLLRQAANFFEKQLIEG